VGAENFAFLWHGIMRRNSHHSQESTDGFHGLFDRLLSVFSAIYLPVKAPVTPLALDPIFGHSAFRSLPSHVQLSQSQLRLKLGRSAWASRF
jgi:hypothetical protein